ncbi:MAG: CoA transferase, partial [Pseudomonadota bacterium]
YAGLYAATGVLVALAEREVSGRGQWVQSSLLEAQIALMDFQAARYLVEGEAPEQAGNDHPTSTPMGVIATSDGHLNLGVAGDGQWQALCRALNRPDLAEDPRFLGVQDRLDHREACWAEIRPEFAKATSAEWMRRLGAESVPCGPIYRMNEVFDDPQVRHTGIAQTVEHPRRGPIRLVGQPVTLSRTPARLSSAAPDAGAHNAELLAELGLSEAEIEALRAEAAI